MRLAFRLAGSCSIPWRVDAERRGILAAGSAAAAFLFGLIDGAGAGRASELWRVEGLAAAFECRPDSVVGNSRSGYAFGSRTFLESAFHFLALMLAAQLFSGSSVRSPMTSTPPVWGMSLFGCFPDFSGRINSNKTGSFLGLVGQRPLQ